MLKRVATIAILVGTLDHCADEQLPAMPSLVAPVAPLRVSSVYDYCMPLLTEEATTRWAERCERGGNRPALSRGSVSCWAPGGDTALWEVRADDLEREEFCEYSGGRYDFERKSCVDP